MAGESQIMDETVDLQNDLNETATLGGFIVNETVNQSVNETNWTLGKKMAGTWPVVITYSFQ